MNSAVSDADVLVAGAGPAGSLAAFHLARLGIRVVLVHSRARTRQHLGETLPASVPRLLGAYGLALPPEVAAARPPSHRVKWAGRDEPVAAQPEGGEDGGPLFVHRDRLDAWAREEARNAGATLVEGTVTGLRDEPDGAGGSDDGGGSGSEGGGAVSGGGVDVVGLRLRDGTRTRVAARLVMDATGRSGALTRARRLRPGFRTTAITAHFQSGQPTGTMIASFPDGWVWTAPLLDGRRDVTVMLDAEDAAGDPEAAYRAGIRAAPLGDAVRGEPVTPLRAADVTPYRLEPTPGFRSGSRSAPAPALALPVGDAFSALDPLSGRGTMKAMDSGLAGAVVARTALLRPRDRDLALQFHETREQALALAAGRRIAAFYAAESRFAERRFWRRRSRPDPESAPESEPAPKEPPAAAPLDPETRLAPVPGVRAERRGVLEGDWIVPAEVLVRPGNPRPARRFGPVNLADLFRAACRSSSAREAVAAHAASGEASARDVRAALDWLVRERFLRPAAPSD